MKTFIAYRHTGETDEALHKLLLPVREALAQKGVEAYCTFFHEDEFTDDKLTPQDIMAHAFGIIDDIDFLFVVQASEQRSEGMLMEVGYCVAKEIPIIVSVRDTITNSYLPDMADVTMRWQNVPDLCRQISELTLPVHL